MAHMNDVTVIAARQRLIQAKSQSTEDQQRDEREIREAFRVWWSAGPDEDEFHAVMGRVVLSAGILYVMTMPRTPTYFYRAS